MASIFHAFNMKYTAIGEIAKHLVDMGFSHVQFPPIQTTRTLSPMDGELLRSQIKACYIQLQSFYELCLKAKEKSRLYQGHIFDHVLKCRTYYINQPTLRYMHHALLNGVPYSHLIEHVYNHIGTIDSCVVRAMTSDTDHPWFQIARMVLDGIDPSFYSEPLYENTEMQYYNIQLNLKNINRTIASYKNKNQTPPNELLEAYRVNTSKRSQLQDLRRRLQMSKKLQTYMKLADKVSEIQTCTNLPPFHASKAKQLLECIWFYEYIIYPPWWLIYQPVKMAIGNTCLGTVEEIHQAIQKCKTSGLQVIVDIVVNNLAAVAGEYDDWNPIVKNGVKGDEIPVVRLKQLLRDAFGSDDWNIVTPPRDCRIGQEPTQCWMSLALPQLNQSHPFIIEAQKKFLQSLLDLGVDGVRIDAAAHLSPMDCHKIIHTFPGLSYIEYIGGSETWRKYPMSEYERMVRLEDFDIGESFFHGEYKQNRNPDSVIMLMNHDHLMGSLPSFLYSILPSCITYNLALVHFIQRVEGHILLLPYEVESEIVVHALKKRNMRLIYV